MNIRELTPSDADAVAALEAVLFSDETPWSREVLLTQFAQPYTFYIGAFDDEGALLGYAGLAMLGPRNEPEFEIHTIGVAPGAQRRGVGGELMDQLVHTADLVDGPMFLEVRTDNVAALGMYKRYGFSVVGTRKNYYQPSGADAYTMMRPRKSEREQA
ncbi:ribosomal protein S18-alanine N-acetyltransferase [Corynebacterium sp. NML130628]|uniref:ribosomal protein S18-alanine N-acetyltransferase n=1 Tax=Corynebacterium sp. NML130628 TaxID=1906333 RepID=UPI0008FADEC4|nr:ribosomal protein S18-alanine N-acetyltransferase [Corynebacterium sp. NML130628]OIR40278.1 ribosomal-protein-alanine N-acetyltransferase [Corynebacterium sp. NML130628]